MGFELVATSGTAEVLREAGVEVETIKKLAQGRPNLLDYMKDGQVQYVFNSPSGKGSRTDEGQIRAAAVSYGVPCVTTVPGCLAVVQALQVVLDHPAPSVCSLQEWFGATD